MSLPLQAARRAVEHRARLAELFPWTTSPLLIGAPMRVFTGPAVAVAIARAGGLGFIGPGETPESSTKDLADAKSLLAKQPLTPPKASHSSGASTTTPAAPATSSLLPIGVGFQVWNGNLESATAAVSAHRPCAVWLFAPKDGQAQLDQWTTALRQASPGTQVWIQVGTLREAVEAAHSSGADALVLQGAEAGGHGRTSDGIGLISLLPEVADALASNGHNVPLIGAGGIADGRGAVAALGLGAAGVAMGTRFLAATEARVNPAYQAEVVRATDGAANTGRTHLYNHLRGTFGWPEEKWAPRGLLNQSWADKEHGVSFDELKVQHDAAAKEGGKAAWGPEGRVATYVSASVGLVRSVEDAGTIIENTRREIQEIKSLLV